MGFLKRVILDLLSVWRQAQVYESEKTIHQKNMLFMSKNSQAKAGMAYL